MFRVISYSCETFKTFAEAIDRAEKLSFIDGDAYKISVLDKNDKVIWSNY